MSTNPLNTIHCPIRKLDVIPTPEERVRQALIQYMTDQLGFPASYLVLERSLDQMPHLTMEKQLPQRRTDIVCFAKEIHPNHALYPLLIVECKAVKLTTQVIDQVAGYNRFMKAYFIAIANQAGIRTGWYDSTQNDYTFIDYLPTYQDLLKIASSKMRLLT